MIKSISLLLGFFFFQISGYAQITAVTGTGDEVILYENGTWKYAKKSDTAATEIQTNPTNFQKQASCTFKVSSNLVDNVNIYLNPKKWTFKKGEEGGSAEYAFNYGGKDAYGMLISERVKIPLMTLREAALSNAAHAAPDIKIMKEEYRNVNGNQVMFLQLQGTIKNISFTYFNYYYTSERGTIQLLTYTFTNLIQENKSAMEELLNGLVITK